MSTHLTETAASEDLAAFDRTTSRWGRITMLMTLIVSLAGPTYLVFFGGFGITGTQLWAALAAVVGTFFVIFLVEPLTYYPILGQAAMYQAFMIGNISNKLLPAVLVAQTSVGAKPGTRRGELAASMAICGAVLIHIISLLLFVGVLGTWLISVIPMSVIEVARLYILPAVLGAVLVQCIVSMKQPRVTLIALGVAAAVTFVLLPLFPSLAFFGTAIAVLATVVLSWVLRAKQHREEAVDARS